MNNKQIVISHYIYDIKTYITDTKDRKTYNKYRKYFVSGIVRYKLRVSLKNEEE